MNMIRVTKMQGLGNDFVIIDYKEFERAEITMSALAKKVCDRNFGIGADGMIIPADSEIADIKWFFYNSDGTTAQMCGNGIRCFAKYCYDHHIVDKKKFDVETLAGIITPEIMEDGNVKVNMAKPILEPKEIPFTSEVALRQEIKIDDKTFTMNAISMGNPHCVIFTQEKDLLKLAKKYGPKIECDKAFPEGVNVEFARILSENEIDMRVYERGCGITLACGTGACAAVVAAILNNLTENKVKVNLLGGSLFIEWQGHAGDINHDVFMTGPAEYSFFADYIL